ncbi:unnamed protein product [Amoebophrya sp. A25]|nr:unnamed protein product [Amoebophrya sp. A25]|eukprot:GSA25T00011150001.1
MRKELKKAETTEVEPSQGGRETHCIMRQGKEKGSQPEPGGTRTFDGVEDSNTKIKVAKSRELSSTSKSVMGGSQTKLGRSSSDVFVMLPTEMRPFLGEYTTSEKMFLHQQQMLYVRRNVMSRQGYADRAAFELHNPSTHKGLERLLKTHTIRKLDDVVAETIHKRPAAKRRALPGGDDSTSGHRMAELEDKVDRSRCSTRTRGTQEHTVRTPSKASTRKRKNHVEVHKAKGKSTTLEKSKVLPERFLLTNRTIKLRHLLRLKKPVNGVRDGPKRFYDSLKAHLLRIGFKQSSLEPTMFYFYEEHRQSRNERTSSSRIVNHDEEADSTTSCTKTLIGFVLVYVDDLLHAGNSRFYDEVYPRILERFQVGAMESASAPKGMMYVGHKISTSSLVLASNEDTYGKNGYEKFSRITLDVSSRVDGWAPLIESSSIVARVLSSTSATELDSSSPTPTCKDSLEPRTRTATAVAVAQEKDTASAVVSTLEDHKHKTKTESEIKNCDTIIRRSDSAAAVADYLASTKGSQEASPRHTVAEIEAADFDQLLKELQIDVGKVTSLRDSRPDILFLLARWHAYYNIAKLCNERDTVRLAACLQDFKEILSSLSSRSTSSSSSQNGGTKTTVALKFLCPTSSRTPLYNKSSLGEVQTEESAPSPSPTKTRMITSPSSANTALTASTSIDFSEQKKMNRCAGSPPVPKRGSCSRSTEGRHEDPVLHLVVHLDSRVLSGADESSEPSTRTSDDSSKPKDSFFHFVQGYTIGLAESLRREKPRDAQDLPRITQKNYRRSDEHQLLFEQSTHRRTSTSLKKWKSKRSNRTSTTKCTSRLLSLLDWQSTIVKYSCKATAQKYNTCEEVSTAVKNFAGNKANNNNKVNKNMQVSLTYPVLLTLIRIVEDIATMRKLFSEANGYFLDHGVAEQGQAVSSASSFIEGAGHSLSTTSELSCVQRQQSSDTRVGKPHSADRAPGHHESLSKKFEVSNNVVVVIPRRGGGAAIAPLLRRIRMLMWQEENRNKNNFACDPLTKKEMSTAASKFSGENASASSGSSSTKNQKSKSSNVKTPRTEVTNKKNERNMYNAPTSPPNKTTLITTSSLENRKQNTDNTSSHATGTQDEDVMKIQMDEQFVGLAKTEQKTAEKLLQALEQHGLRFLPRLVYRRENQLSTALVFLHKMHRGTKSNTISTTRKPQEAYRGYLNRKLLRGKLHSSSCRLREGHTNSVHTSRHHRLAATRPEAQTLTRSSNHHRVRNRHSRIRGPYVKKKGSALLRFLHCSSTPTSCTW